MHHFDQVEFLLPRYYRMLIYSLLIQYSELKIYQTYQVLEGFTSLNSSLLTFNDHLNMLGKKPIIIVLLSHNNTTRHVRAIALQFNVDGNGSHIALEHRYF